MQTEHRTLHRRGPGWLAAALLGLLAVAARAETWTLTNGDRLTGVLIEEGAEVLEIKHPQLGLLSLPRSAIRPPEAAPAADTVAKLPKPPPAPARKWKRSLEVGFAQQSGTKSKQDLTIRAQLDGKLGADTYRGTARLLNSESQEKQVTDRTEADFRWRHDVSKRLFTQTQTTYFTDDIRLIDLSLEQQIGGGYRVVDAKRHQANVGAGAVVQYLERPGYEPARGLLASFFQDYAYTMNSRLKLTQEVNILASDSGTFNLQTIRPGTNDSPADGTYRMKFNAALQGKVTSEISFNVRYEYDYDRSVADPDLRGDQRVTTSLGYVW